MNDDVLIVGIGQTTVGEHWDLSLRELAFYAMEAAIKDAGGLQPQSLFVGNLLAPSVSGQAHLGALIADFSGLRGIEAQTIEAAGASGGAALRAGFLAIKSGLVDTAVVVGVEKITDKVSEEVDSELMASMDGDYEAVHGLTPSAQAGMLMRRYIYETGVDRDSFAIFPLVAHANGVHNSNAMFRKAINPSTYQRAGLVCDPLNMFDVAPDADGAAAVVMTRSSLSITDQSHPSVRIVASNITTDTLALHDRPDPLDFRAVRRSTERAIYQSGITLEQVDYFEPYDLFSVYAALSLEAAGLVQPRSGWKLGMEEAFSLSGALPILTFGGLKARGNPWGATGVYQVVEAVLQLRGQAGSNQVPGARFGMVQCMGGPASTVATHILEAMN